MANGPSSSPYNRALNAEPASSSAARPVDAAVRKKKLRPLLKFGCQPVHVQHAAVRLRLNPGDLISQSGTTYENIKSVCLANGLPEHKFVSALLGLCRSKDTQAVIGRCYEALPLSPPEYYVFRADPREDIVSFLRRVWMRWISAGLLTRAALRKLDPNAYKAVENWVARRALPVDVALPTRRLVRKKPSKARGRRDTEQSRGSASRASNAPSKPLVPIKPSAPTITLIDGTHAREA